LETLVTSIVSIVLRPDMEPKERILVKADELFNRYGLRSVSMDDIAAQVGMSKKTLYQYYADKEELVSEVFSAIMESNKLGCQDAEKCSENAIHEVFLAFDKVQQMFADMHPGLLFEMEKYHAVTFNKFKTFRDSFIYSMIRNNLDRGIREGLYRDDIDVDIMARYRIHSIMLAFNPAIFSPTRSSLLHIEIQLLENFLYGLSTAKGIKMILKYKKQRTKNK
jgi:TetR/AcrR family transcriptional regulator, cholesterol catabolism regulator